MGSTGEHSDLVNAIFNALNRRGDCRVWKNNTGQARIQGRLVRFGYEGSPDIIGFTSDGRFLGIECKTGGAVKSKVQRAFHNMSSLFGARVYTIHSVAEISVTLDRLGLPEIDLTTLGK